MEKNSQKPSPEIRRAINDFRASQQSNKRFSQALVFFAFIQIIFAFVQVVLFIDSKETVSAVDTVFLILMAVIFLFVARLADHFIMK